MSNSNYPNIKMAHSANSANSNYTQNFASGPPPAPAAPPPPPPPPGASYSTNVGVAGRAAGGAGGTVQHKIVTIPPANSQVQKQQTQSHPQSVQSKTSLNISVSSSTVNLARPNDLPNNQQQVYQQGSMQQQQHQQQQQQQQQQQFQQYASNQQSSGNTQNIGANYVQPVPAPPTQQQRGNGPRTVINAAPQKKAIPLAETLTANSVSRPSFEMANAPQLPPSIVTQPAANLHAAEGETLKITCQVVPANDATLTVEWFKNAASLKAGSRFDANLDRGYAVLTIFHSTNDDNGQYSCVARNVLGQCQSSQCLVLIDQDDAVLTRSNVPQNQAVLADLEQRLQSVNMHGGGGGAGDAAELEEFRAQQQQIRFVKNLLGQMNVRENQPVHLEARIQPFTCPNLRVDWFKNGAPVLSGSRINTILDRGFVILDIVYCYPEDSGQYCCMVTNGAGSSVTSNALSLNVSPDDLVNDKTVLPPEIAESIEKFDRQLYENQLEKNNFLNQEEEESDCAPNVQITPKSAVVVEGSGVKFTINVTGNPRPMVEWFINGELVNSNSVCRVVTDGAIGHFELIRCSEVGQFQIEVRCSNTLGQTGDRASLEVQSDIGYQTNLRHVQPDNSSRRFNFLKKVEVTPELQSALGKLKSRTKLDVESDDSLRSRSVDGRAAGTPDATGQMYTNVYSQLRKADEPTYSGQSSLRQRNNSVETGNRQAGGRGGAKMNASAAPPVFGTDFSKAQRKPQIATNPQASSTTAIAPTIHVNQQQQQQKQQNPPIQAAHMQNRQDQQQQVRQQQVIQQQNPSIQVQQMQQQNQAQHQQQQMIQQQQQQQQMIQQQQQQMIQKQQQQQMIQQQQQQQMIQQQQQGEQQQQMIQPQKQQQQQQGRQKADSIVMQRQPQVNWSVQVQDHLLIENESKAIPAGMDNSVSSVKTMEIEAVGIGGGDGVGGVRSGGGLQLKHSADPNVSFDQVYDNEVISSIATDEFMAMEGSQEKVFGHDETEAEFVINLEN